MDSTRCPVHKYIYIKLLLLCFPIWRWYWTLANFRLFLTIYWILIFFLVSTSSNYFIIEKIQKLFYLIFLVRFPLPLCKKWTKIFFHQNLTIYTPFESPCRVSTISVAFKSFRSIFGRKIFENKHFFTKSSKTEKTDYIKTMMLNSKKKLFCTSNFI
jgi:hypothetical protein